MQCQSCGVAKRYVVGGLRCYHLIRRVAISYRLSNNHVSICSGLAAIMNGMFKAISGPISKTKNYDTIVSLLRLGLV